jgi:hypothetical protein
MSDDGGLEEFLESFLAAASSRLRRSFPARNRPFPPCNNAISPSSVSIRFSKGCVNDAGSKWNGLSHMISSDYGIARQMSTPGGKISRHEKIQEM